MPELKLATSKPEVVILLTTRFSIPTKTPLRETDVLGGFRGTRVRIASIRGPLYSMRTKEINAYVDEFKSSCYLNQGTSIFERNICQVLSAWQDDYANSDTDSD